MTQGLTIAKDAKIYIAGHTGLVGLAVLKKFQQEGYTNLITKTHLELDLVRQDLVEKFLKKERVEYIIIAAALVGGIKANSTYPAEFEYENLMIQSNLIWAAHLMGVKKLLFFGSSCIYPRECPQPMKEEYLLTGPFEPTNEAFAIAKVTGVKLCQYIQKQFKQDFISVVPANVYGPNDHFETENSHVISAMITKFAEAKKGRLESVEVWGSGSAARDFLYIDDLAEAIFFIMQNYKDKELVNIGTGEGTSIKKLVKMIMHLIGFEGKLRFDTTKPDGMPKKLLDINRISSLGWKHTTSLKSGLKKTIQWYNDNVANLARE